MNGYGERVGNANLVSILPNLSLKMGRNVRCAPNLAQLRDLSLFFDELANLRPDPKAPFVGQSAFAHKGGLHANAAQKVARSYEHIDPALVGNRTPGPRLGHGGAKQPRPQGAGVRGRAGREEPRDEGACRRAEGARVPGLRVRGGGRLLQAPRRPHARAPQGVLRGRGIPGDDRAPRSRDLVGGDGAGEGEGRVHPHGRGGLGADRGPGPGPAPRPGEDLPAAARR